MICNLMYDLRNIDTYNIGTQNPGRLVVKHPSAIRKVVRSYSTRTDWLVGFEPQMA